MLHDDISQIVYAVFSRICYISVCDTLNVRESSPIILSLVRLQVKYGITSTQQFYILEQFAKYVLEQ